MCIGMYVHYLMDGGSLGGTRHPDMYTHNTVHNIRECKNKENFKNFVLNKQLSI